MANTKQGIYYQDNYSSVADVPNDMKKMAESMDTELEKDRNGLKTNETKILELQSDNETNKTNISNLQSDNVTNKSNIQSLQTDNTKNKQGISDIKQEQTTQNANIEQNTSNIANINEEIANINEKDTTQDTNIETLTQRLNEKDNQIAELKAENEDLKEDLSNSQIHGKASGEYVHLSDSAKMNCDIAVLGNSRQETREGYNLLKINDFSITQNGVTLSAKDGILSIKGTCTGNDSIFFTGYINKTEFNPILLNNIATMQADNVPKNMELNFGSSSSGYYFQLKNGTTKVSKTFNENITYCSVYVSSGSTYDATIKLQLLLGNEDKPYEPYGAMPSIDYPSKIECVSSANVKVWNKNLFSTNVTNKTISSSNVKSTEIENGIRISYSGSTSSTYLGYIYIIKDIRNYVGKAFAVSAKAKASASNNTRMNLVLCDINGNNRKVLKSSDLSNVEMNVTIPEIEGDVHFLGIVFYANVDGTIAKDDYVDYTDIQVEEDVITDYIAHEEQNYPVDMQEEMLEEDYFDLENGKEVHNWNEIVFNGTENWVIASTLTNTVQYKLDVSGLSITSRNAKSENILVEQTYGDREQLVIGRKLTEGLFSEVFINFSKNRATTLEEFKALLNTNNIKLHYMSEPRKLDLTEQQTQQLKALLKAKTYKNITNITTDTIAVLDVDYKRDLETYQKQQDDRITAIEQLLSTTATSAMLLDNVQSDLESEVK